LLLHSNDEPSLLEIILEPAFELGTSQFDSYIERTGKISNVPNVTVARDIHCCKTKS